MKAGYRYISFLFLTAALSAPAAIVTRAHRRTSTGTNITIKNVYTIALTRIITIGMTMRTATTINISPRTIESIETTRS